RKNCTAPERMLWLHLKNKQLRARFRRQYGIGHYIADFCSPRQKLVIEIEGGIHDNEEEKYYDQGRRLNIEDLGFRVLYFTNEEIEQEINKVIEVIKKHIK
ncbi:endonuclease domain-containing protein, partial [bacterium]|nr:endonuclease domain-containing protein [bacterium]